MPLRELVSAYWQREQLHFHGRGQLLQYELSSHVSKQLISQRFADTLRLELVSPNL